MLELLGDSPSPPLLNWRLFICISTLLVAMRGWRRLASREWYVRVAFESDRESRSGYLVDLSESEIFAVEMIGKEPEFTREKNLI